MAKVLSFGETPDINSGETSGPQIIVKRKYRIALFSGTIDPTTTAGSPNTKANVLDSIPPIGQRWPRREESKY